MIAKSGKRKQYFDMHNRTADEAQNTQTHAFN